MKLSYVVIPLITIAVAAIGSLCTQIGLEPWYRALEKPPGTPPAWVFAPVWTTIYILTAGAALMLWDRRERGRSVRVALWLLGINAVANALWSCLFFALQIPVWGLLDAFVIAVTAAGASIFAAFRSWPAAVLLLPYVFWALYASYLNAFIVILN
jgi:tryptophan-rich sensory protein